MTYYREEAEGVGRLTKAPRLFESTDRRTGEAVPKVLLTVVTGFGKYQKFHNIEAYGELAARAFESLPKGALVLFHGTPTEKPSKVNRDGETWEEVRKVIKATRLHCLHKPKASPDETAEQEAAPEVDDIEDDLPPALAETEEEQEDA